MRYSIVDMLGFMGVKTDTRARMITSASMLLREKGVAGTTVAGVLEHSGGPRGSVRFHFPGGRQEILTEALREAGDAVTARLRLLAEGGASPAEIFAAMCDHYAQQLEATDFAAGCPVWAVVQEDPADLVLGEIARGIIDDWVAALDASLAPAGAAAPVEDEPADLAAWAVGSLEGAISLSRLQRSRRPIDVARSQVTRVLAG